MFSFRKTQVKWSKPKFRIFNLQQYIKQPYINHFHANVICKKIASEQYPKGYEGKRKLAKELNFLIDLIKELVGSVKKIEQQTICL